MAKETGITVRLNMAMTLDGHTVLPGNIWQTTSKEDKRRMNRLREWAHCVIVSRSVIENDNPNLFVRDKPDQKTQPVPVIVIKNAAKPVNPGARVFNKSHRPGFIFYHADVPGSAYTHPLPEKWQAIQIASVQEILQYLQQNHHRNFLLEGGPVLNGLFFEQDLIDEIYFTLVPFLFAGKTTDRLAVSEKPIDTRRFKLVRVERRKNEMFFRYIRKK